MAEPPKQNKRRKNPNRILSSLIASFISFLSFPFSSGAALLFFFGGATVVVLFFFHFFLCASLFDCGGRATLVVALWSPMAEPIDRRRSVRREHQKKINVTFEFVFSSSSLAVTAGGRRRQEKKTKEKPNRHTGNPIRCVCDVTGEEQGATLVEQNADVCIPFSVKSSSVTQNKNNNSNDDDDDDDDDDEHWERDRTQRNGNSTRNNNKNNNNNKITRCKELGYKDCLRWAW